MSCSMYVPVVGRASGGPLSSGRGPEGAGHNPAAPGAAPKPLGRCAGVGLGVFAPIEI